MGSLPLLLHRWNGDGECRAVSAFKRDGAVKLCREQIDQLQPRVSVFLKSMFSGKPMPESEMRSDSVFPLSVRVTAMRISPAPPRGNACFSESTQVR